MRGIEEIVHDSLEREGQDEKESDEEEEEIVDETPTIPEGLTLIHQLKKIVLVPGKFGRGSKFFTST